MNTSLLGAKASLAASFLFFVFFIGELGVVHAEVYADSNVLKKANSAVAARFKCEVRLEYRRICYFYSFYNYNSSHDAGNKCSPVNYLDCSVLTYTIKDHFCPIFHCPVSILNGQNILCNYHNFVSFFSLRILNHQQLHQPTNRFFKQNKQFLDLIKSNQIAAQMMASTFLKSQSCQKVLKQQ
jgi:hypothetical protein